MTNRLKIQIAGIVLIIIAQIFLNWLFPGHVFLWLACSIAAQIWWNYHITFKAKF